MSNPKFSIGDEVITSGEYGIIKRITLQDEEPIYIVNIDDFHYAFPESELDLKYSFSKTEIWVAMDIVYGPNTYYLKNTDNMSALQVKNKFGSVILDQLLLNRSPEV